MTDVIKRAPFSPVVTGAVLYLLTQAPAAYREPALHHLAQILSNENTARLVTALKWLFAAGLINNANTYLNNWTFNDYKLTANKKDWDWPNEIAVVTGASSGFGKLFSQDLALKGVRIAAIDINDPPSDLANNRRVTFFKCDVTDPEAVKATAQAIQEQLGHPSILINNAGIAGAHGILQTPPKFLRKIFDVNLLSHYYLLQAFAPAMIERNKGHILTIASVASFVAGSGFVDYCATKAGAWVLHDGLTTELRTIHKCTGVKTTIVHPTWTDTPMIASHVDQLKKHMHVMQPQEVSDAVVNQIMACRSGQLILGTGSRVISTLRAWPVWLSRIVMSPFQVDPNKESL